MCVCVCGIYMCVFRWGALVMLCCRIPLFPPECDIPILEGIPGEIKSTLGCGTVRNDLWPISEEGWTDVEGLGVPTGVIVSHGLLITGVTNHSLTHIVWNTNAA